MKPLEDLTEVAESIDEEEAPPEDIVDQQDAKMNIGLKTEEDAWPSETKSGADPNLAAFKKAVRERQCHLCDFRHHDRHMLSRHVNKVHRGIKYRRCPDCDYEAQQKSHMDEHVKNKHHKVRDMQCRHCGYKTGRPGSMAKHMIGKHGQRLRRGENVVRTAVWGTAMKGKWKEEDPHADEDRTEATIEDGHLGEAFAANDVDNPVPMPATRVQDDEGGDTRRELLQSAVQTQNNCNK